MAADRTKSGTPLSELPELTGQVRPAPAVPTPLTTRLSPVVDRIRHLYTRFGLRPYRVFLVHTVWSGSRRGEGAEMEISRREILPTPNVVDMQGTTEVMRAVGMSEEGGITVEQISTKYTEDDLLGLTPDLIDPAMPRTGLQNGNFFYEVTESRPSTPAPQPRRYVPDGVPMLGRDRFQWRISLKKQDYNSRRNGTFVPRTQQ